jgi:DNA polymerase-3 subunit beta
MKLIIGADRLNQALARVIGIVPPKPTLPILTHVLLRAEDGILRIIANNMDIAMMVDTPCAVDEPGGVVIQAKRLTSFVRECEGDVRLETQPNGNIGIFFSGGSLEVPVFQEADFPAVNLEPGDGFEVALSGHDLNRMASTVAFAHATERTRIALTGVLLQVSDGQLVMVATDGHVLAKSVRQARVSVGKKVETIIPPQTLVQAVRLIGEGLDLNALVIERGRIAFRFDGVLLISKTIEGPYPAYDQVVPKDNPHVATVAVARIERTVRRALVTSNAITRSLRLAFGAGCLEVGVRNMDIGAAFTESLEIAYDSDPLTIGVNGDFLRTILSKIDSDEADIKLATPTSASLIIPAPVEECEQLTYLFMPLRLND